MDTEVNVENEVQPERSDEPHLDDSQAAGEVKEQEADPYNEVQDKANRLIIEAEKFKASVNAPKDRFNQIVKSVPQSVADNVYFQDEIKEDDHFFHLTCHVDPNLVSKVERGEFVELEKLLPRPKGGNLEDGHKTELIFREGKPVIVPHVDKSRAITGIWKWDQAFRIYAAIYSQANPGRSSEIWQYVHVINTAAYNHAWSQVAEYDSAFRQMMASNPKHSWARIYAQMWNICFFSW